VVVGSISCDRLRTRKSPAVATVGGAGLYAGLGASVAGARVGLVGLVSDEVPCQVMTRLRARIDDAGVLRLAGTRLHFDIAYDEHWQAHYAVDGAEAERLVNERLIPAAYRAAPAFHLCPLGVPAAQLSLAQAIRAFPGSAVLSATVFRNRITAEPAIVEALWTETDLLVCNAEEAVLLTGRRPLPEALACIAEAVRARDRDMATCVTDGAHGAYLVTGTGVLRVPSHPACVVDPTGAGEAFAGALSAVLLSGAGPLLAMATASAVASLAVEGMGPERLLTATAKDVHARTAAVSLAIEERCRHA
jgi:sugar/nucleoside kinase (ribokinase family)